MIGRLNHIAIAVPDLAAATRLYAETLGAKVPVPPQYARATVETWPGAKIVRPPKQAEAAPPR